ncbi:MAG: hypothetical protein ACRCWD_05275 [Culicoidibacterales bacterium]
MEPKKMKKDILAATAVLFATIFCAIIGYFAITTTLQLWQTFLQYLAEGQNVTLFVLFEVIWQNVGLQIVTPILAVYGCYVLASYIFSQHNLRAARLQGFWFGVYGLLVSSVMLILPTPQYPLVITVGLVIPSILALFLSIERPEKIMPPVHNGQGPKQSRVATKRHYRRYLAK